MKQLFTSFLFIIVTQTIYAQSPNLQGNCTVTGYFFHPSAPRSINTIKTITQISTNTYQADLVDLGGSNYKFQFSVNAGNYLYNWVAVGATPAAPASGFMTIDNATAIAAGYNSNTYNNFYDAATRTFYMHYGYAVGSTNQTGYTRLVYEKWVLPVIPVAIGVFPGFGTFSDKITIYGKNFTNVNSGYGISLGGTNVDSSVIVSDNQITAWVGGGATGKINVSNDNGSDSSLSFVYKAPIVPTNTQWQYVGNAGISSGTANGVAMAIDNNNVAYIVYSDLANGQAVAVKKFNGSNWVALGSSISIGKATYSNIVIDNNNIPYIAYVDSTNGGKITVQKFNGSNWTIVGSSGFAPFNNPSTVSNIPLALDGNNVPYVLSKDSSGGTGKIYVYKFTGGTWVSLGFAGQPGYCPGSLAVDKLTNTPYVFYDDGTATFFPYPAKVVKYDGTNWVTVGNTNFANTINGIFYGAIEIDKFGIPIVSMQDDNGFERLSTYKLVSGIWTPIGSKYFNRTRSYYNSFKLDSANNPVHFFIDNSYNKQGSVIGYSNTGWNFVGARGFVPAIGLSDNCLALDRSNTPYIVFIDKNNNNKVSVMKYLSSICSNPVNISISSNMTGVVCAGTPVSFTASASGGCGNIIYQWYKSGYPVGTNSTTYSDNNLLKGDTIYCIATAGINSYTSNKLDISIDAPLANSIIITSAGYGNSAIYNGANATDIGLSSLNSVATDHQNNVYVGTATVTLKIDSSNKIVAQYPTGINNGMFVYGSDIYYSNTYNHKIFKINVSTNIISLVAGNGTVGFSGDGGLAINAQLAYPSGLCVDNNGNLYITDNNNHRIRKVNLSTGIITTVAGSGGFVSNGGFDSFGGYSGDGGLAIAATLKFPSDVKVDINGNLYIADYASIRFVNISTGIITSLAGGATPGYNGDGGLAISTQLAYPKGIAFDKKGNLYITDNDKLVRKIDTATKLIHIIAGNINLNNSCGDGGTALNATFSSLGELAIDNQENIFIREFTRLRKIINVYKKPQVFITMNACGVVCKGTKVTFVATGVYAGNSPSYQWKKNGVVVGFNSSNYVDSTLAQNDSITCSLTSNSLCNSNATVVSNYIKPVIYNITTPTVSISTKSNIVCPNNNVFIKASVSNPNGGGSAQFQWYKNGISASGNNFSYINSYTDSTAQNGDSIYLKIYTPYTYCVTSPFAQSNGIRISINSNILNTFNPLPDTTKSCGVNADLDAGANFIMYNWSTGDTTQTIVSNLIGKYKVQVLNALGCGYDSTFVKLSNVKISPQDTLVMGGSQVQLSVGRNTNKLSPILNIPGYYQNWNPAAKPYLYSVNANSIYEGYVYFNKGVVNEFKFAKGGWTLNWGTNGSETVDNINKSFNGVLAPNGGNITYPIAGYYLLKVDNNALTYSGKLTNWSVIGSALPGGANVDVPMVYDSIAEVWKLSVTLTAGGDFKFRANNEWALSYGLASGSNNVLTEAGISIPAPVNSGTYFITLDLSKGPGNYKYSISSGATIINSQKYLWSTADTTSYTNTAPTVTSKYWVRVTNGSNVCTDTATVYVFGNIQGNYITPINKVIKNVLLSVSETGKFAQNKTISDFSTGSYNLAGITGNNYVLKPSKNSDINKINGVSAIDIILTQKHILNQIPFNSPYKIIAADVNNDKKVTTIDIIFMKRLILGIDTTFTGNRLWAFVDSAYTFPNPANPFPYKDSISYTGLNASKTNQSFIGVKLGDVDYNWNPAVAKPGKCNNTPVELYYDMIDSKQTGFSPPQADRNDDMVSPQGLIKIPIKVKNFKDLLGIQYTLNFNSDAYEYVGIENNLLKMDFNDKRLATNNGKISFLWADANSNYRTLEDGTVLFELILKSKKGEWGVGNSELELSNDITNIEAYDKDYQLHNIILTERIIPNSQPPISKDFWTVSPNPTTGTVKVNIVSKVNKVVSFELSNSEGKVLMQQAFETLIGNNSFTINLKQKTQLPAGVYFMKAVGLEGEEVKRIEVR